MNSNKFVSDQEIAERVHFKGLPPKVIVGVGPSRSGTTLYARIFSEQGIPTWYQPFKAILRGYLHDNNTHLNISNESCIFIKETLGAYTKNEALLNPVKILLLAGIPKENIHLIPLVREPFSTASSIVEKFSFFKDREDLVDICNLCFESIEEIVTFTASKGIQTTTFVYEAWRDNSPVLVMEKLFLRLGVNIVVERLVGWQKLKSLETALPNMYWLYEPAHYYHNDFFEKIKNSEKINFYNKSIEKITDTLTSVQIEKIKNGKALRIYDDLRKNSCSDLNIIINPTPIKL